MARVGVFVNKPPDDIAELVDTLSLDVVQLHGDEDADAVAAVVAATYNCRPRPEILVALRLPPDANAQDLAQAGDDPRFASAAGVLLDAARDGQFGGSGQALDWASLSAWRLREVFGRRDIILAGGLSPQNVESAIALIQPDGVDVASGVESAPGIKNPDKLVAFVTAAVEAFGRTR